MTGVKKNFGYSLILTVSNYLFPLLTYPYVSRVLGVTNIGICNYIDSIIHYFVIFSSMGTLFLGIREIAGAKDNKNNLSRVFSTLIVLNLVSISICTLMLLWMMYYMDDFTEYRNLLWIGILKLWGTVFAIDWLYKGLEDFKYITHRTIVVKLLYVASVFIFIQKKDDYVIYFFLTTMMFVVNTVINCVYAKNFVSLVFNNLYCKKYFKPFCVLGLQAILTSMYTSFNVAYLGYTTNNTEVGYYTTATKLFAILLAIYSAFSGVLVPRLSYLIAQKKYEDFKILLSKSQDVLLSVTVPLALFIGIFSPDTISVLAGTGFEGAYLPTRIIMPLIVIIGYEQILVFQIMMPFKDDKHLFYNSIIGAGVGVICNILFVQYYGAIGSAIVWLLSELTVLVAAQICVKKLIGVGFPFVKLLKQCVIYSPMVIILIIMYKQLHFAPFFRLLISGSIFAIYFIIAQIYIIKNEKFVTIKNKFIYN